jgi:predicted acetylornithine/succinylornithine family transaminase
MTANRQDALIDMAGRVLLATYRRQPVVMQRGSGMHVWDVTGKRYLDMTAGISVCALGHAHPALTRTLSEQAQRLLHISNLYFIEEQILAAGAITERSFGGRVFFCNSGAEANEAALKLARRYQSLIAGRPERTRIVSTHGSFHGRSFATVSITGQDRYRRDFGPMLAPVAQVPFGDLDAAARALRSSPACAFIVEPIQADGGIVVPPPGYLSGLRALADETGTLLIFDEVQTGMGRTGRWFGYQHEDIRPDIMALAKALGGGIPVGAIVATGEVAAGLELAADGPAPHASTFGGNPLACAAVRTVIETIEQQGLIERGAAVGAHLAQGLADLVRRHPEQCREARGRGLLQGLVLTGPAGPVVVRCREEGLLLSAVSDVVVRFTPALIAERAHIDQAIAIVDEVLRAPA